MRAWLTRRRTGATLPSAESAAELVRGEPRAIPLVLLHTAGRAGLIAVGLALVGRREHVLRDAFAGALAIEVFVLGYQAVKS